MASSPTAAMERQSNNVPGSAACDGLPCSGPFSAMALDPKRSICAAGRRWWARPRRRSPTPSSTRNAHNAFAAESFLDEIAAVDLIAFRLTLSGGQPRMETSRGRRNVRLEAAARRPPPRGRHHGQGRHPGGRIAEVSIDCAIAQIQPWYS